MKTNSSSLVLFKVLLAFFSLILVEIKAKPVQNYDNHIRKESNQLIHAGERGIAKSTKLTSSGQQRIKRQLDFTIDADHEEGIGTDLAASLSAKLFESADGSTRVDGTARYNQHFDDYSGHGKAKIGGSLHISHNY